MANTPTSPTPSACTEQTVPTHREIGLGIIRLTPRRDQALLAVFLIACSALSYLTIAVGIFFLWFSLLTALGLQPSREAAQLPTEPIHALPRNPSRWERIGGIIRSMPFGAAFRDLAVVLPGLLVGVFFGLIVPVMLAMDFAERRLARRYFERPACLWCRYPLVGLPAARGWVQCPECSACNPATSDVYLDQHRSMWLRWPLRTLGRILRVRIAPSSLGHEITPPRSPANRPRRARGLQALGGVLFWLLSTIGWPILLLLFWAAGEGTRWDYLTQLANAGTAGLVAIMVILAVPPLALIYLPMFLLLRRAKRGPMKSP